MIRGPCHGLISASARKINDDDPTFSLFALLIGLQGIAQAIRAALVLAEPPPYPPPQAGEGRV